MKLLDIMNDEREMMYKLNTQRHNHTEFITIGCWPTEKNNEMKEMNKSIKR